jgi:hypothetical protein
MSYSGEYQEWSDTWVYICAECDTIVIAEFDRTLAADPGGARNSKEKS